MTEHRIQLLDELGSELERVALEREGRRQPRRAWRVRPVALAAVFAALTAAGATAAVTGVFEPEREPDGLVRLAPKEVVAQGTATDGRSWQITASMSDVGFCFGLRRQPFPGASGTPSTSEGCGGPGPGTLTLATSSGGTIKQNALVFGTAPDRASQITVRAGSNVERTVPAVDDELGVKGRFYLAELPIHRLGDVTVIARDSRGVVVAREALRRRTR